MLEGNLTFLHGNNNFLRSEFGYKYKIQNS